MIKLFDYLKTMKTLLIDDDVFIRNAVTLIFEREGCFIMSVGTAEEGLVELKKIQYDIVICDYLLPGMDGIVFFKTIRDLYPDILKVLMTAFGNGRVLYEAMNLGVQDVIEKPLSSNTIENTLTKLIVKE